jgi:hypothetical protein
VCQFEFAYLDPRRDSFRHVVMGAIRRAINLIIGFVLVALGCGELAYFYFIAATRNGWLALAAGIVGSAGLYWLWDEHINTGPRPEN